jgi:hypothetical protein
LAAKSAAEKLPSAPLIQHARHDEFSVAFGHREVLDDQGSQVSNFLEIVTDRARKLQ